MFCIEYTHQQYGVLSQGTLQGGAVPATSSWKIESGGRSTTSDVPIDEDTFMDLWNGCNDLKLFKNCLVKKKSTPDPDPASHHLVRISFQQGNDKSVWRYHIPVDDADEEFAGWLEKLSIPKPGT